MDLQEDVDDFLRITQRTFIHIGPRRSASSVSIPGSKLSRNFGDEDDVLPEIEDDNQSQPSSTLSSRPRSWPEDGCSSGSNSGVDEERVVHTLFFKQRGGL